MEKQSTRKFLKLIVALVALFLLASSALLFASCKEEHEHVLDEGKVTTSATCTTPGVMTFYCTVEGCSYSETKEIEPSGHDYKEDPQQSTQATCTADGSRVMVCSKCDDSYSVTVPATGHTWGEEDVVNATCVTPGSVTRTCENCDATESTVIQPTGIHTYGEPEVEKPATCGSDGVEVETCIYCGHENRKTIYATGDHTLETVVVTPATCENTGLEVERCTVCGYVAKETTLDVLRHKYTLEDGSYNYIEVHEPTCVTPGVRIIGCVRCDDRYEDTIYAATHPALGHKWIVDTADKENPTDLEGYRVTLAPTCTAAGEAVRTCERCGATEDKVLAPTGHSPVGMQKWLADLAKEDPDDPILSMTNAQQIAEFLEDDQSGLGGICHVNKDLTDAEGNALWAYECENENCPCEVVVDEFDTVKHYVEAAEHKFVLSTNPADTALNDDGEPQPASPATCEEDGWAVYVCSVCGDTKGEVLPETGHTLNTLQLDGRNEVIVCEADPVLNDKEDGEAAYYAAMKKAFNDNAKYAAWYAQHSGDYDDFMDDKTNNPNGAYAFCTVCGELQAALEHDYVIGTLEDGKYGDNDYIVGEDGKPVASTTVTEATMTCRNVLVCTNCFNVADRGDHGATVPATCREGGYCEICGEQRTAQLTHSYISLDDVLNGKEADSDSYNKLNYNNKAVTYGQLRDAYEKVVADETWMKPVTATCSSAGTEVYVCYTCLLDAAAGTEFEWSTDELKADSIALGAVPQAGRVYCAFTMDRTAGHDYETVYFDLKATDLSSPKDYAQTNCEFGFKVAYKCKNCDVWYSNPLVPDDPSTTGADKNEAAANKLKSITLDGVAVNNAGFTNTAGFILDLTVDNAELDYDKQGLTQTEIDALQADSNERAHEIFVPANFDKLNAYDARTCVSVANIPVVCLHCGASLKYSATDLAKGEKAGLYTFASAAAIKAYLGLEEDFEQGTDGYVIADALNSNNVFAANGTLVAQTKVDPTNHKNQTFACKSHCNAYVEVEEGGTKVKYYCSAFDADADKTTVKEADLPTGALTDTYHKTVTVTLSLSTKTEAQYLGNYQLYIATVEETDINTTKKTVDWTKVDYSTSKSASLCKGQQNFTFPGVVPADLSTWNGDDVLVLKDGNDVFALKDNTFGFYSNDEADVSEQDRVNTDTVQVTQEDTYFVQFVDAKGTQTRPAGLPVVATTADSLEMAFNAAYAVANTGTAGGKTLTVNVGADIDLSSTANKTGKDSFSDFFGALDEGSNITDYVVDLGGHKITDASADRFIFDAAGTAENTFKANSVTLKNGTIDFKATAAELKPGVADTNQQKVDAASVSLIKPVGDVKLVLDGMTVTTSAGTAIFACDTDDQFPTVTVKNSTITAGGAYGISTNASNAYGDREDVLITIENSKITAGTADKVDASGKVETRGIGGTALFVNIPAVVEVSGSELTANYQVVVARGGNVKINNTKLTLVDTIENPEVTAKNYTSEVGVRPGSLLAAGVTIGNGFVPGLTVQEYRMLGYYGEGNGLARAVITLGNSEESTDPDSTTPSTAQGSYQYATSLTLTNSVEIVNETDYDDIVIASHYSDTTMGAPATAEKPLNVMVTVDSKIAVGIAYCTNWVEGTVKVNGELVKK